VGEEPGEKAGESVPEAAELVGVKHAIAADDGQIFGQGLSDQHAVEGIFVRAGKETGTSRMLNGDRKSLDGLTSKNGFEIQNEIMGDGEFSEAAFGGNFPRRSGADEHGV